MAIRFPGVNGERVETNFVPSTVQTCTFCVWHKRLGVEAGGTIQTILDGGRTASTPNEIRLLDRYGSNEILTLIYNKDGTQFLNRHGGITTLNQEYFFCLIHDESAKTFELYLNGTKILPSVTGYPVGGIETETPTESYFVGANNAGDGETSVNGNIWDLRCYNRCLSQQEINAIYYRRGSDRIVDGLEAWYPLAGWPAGTTVHTNQPKCIKGNGTTAVTGTQSIYVDAPFNYGRIYG